MPKLYKFEEIEKLEENVKKKRIVVEESITKKEFFTLEDKERELENAKAQIKSAENRVKEVESEINEIKKALDIN